MISRKKEKVRKVSVMGNETTFTHNASRNASRNSSIIEKPEISELSPNNETPNLKLNKDIFRLRYIRFKTNDLDATVNFYRLLGMNLDFTTEQHVMANAPKMPISAITSKNNSPQPPKETNERSRSVFKKIILAFSFLSSDAKSNNDNMQLLFEKEIAGKEKWKYQEKPEVISTRLKNEKDDFDWQNYDELKESYSSEYLVIYVKFLNRVMKQFASKGYIIKLKPRVINDIKIGILKDPNGLDIRLLELTPQQLDDPKSQSIWFCRLGYYVIPCQKAESVVEFYENSLTISKGKKEEASEAQILENQKRRYAVRKVKNELQTNQFQLVDSEEYFVGLVHNSFYWMSNFKRDSAFAICFTDQSEIDQSVAEKVRKFSLNIVALGFLIGNLENTIGKVKAESKDLVWEENRYIIQKYGIIGRFLDKLNGSWIELLTTKIPEVPKSHVKERSFPTGENEQEEDQHPILKIDKKKHMNGHSRNYSEGAIFRHKTFMDEDETLFPTKIKKPKIMKLKSFIL